MSRPGFLEGAGFALAASVVAGGASLVLAPVLGPATALRAVVAMVGLAYLAYLLVRARARAGRVSMVVLWACVTAAVLAADPPFVVHVLAQLALVWFARAVWHHASVLGALADLTLTAAGFAAAAWAAERTGSLALSIWCLLLVQAAFVVIPRREHARRARAARALAPDDPFQRAHRAAEAAVRRLSAVR